MRDNKNQTTVLCIARSPAGINRLQQSLLGSGMRIVIASVPDQAVAVCAASKVDAAVIDGESIPDHEWSVAKSLKMVKPSLPVIQIDSGALARAALPEAVDVVIGVDDIETELLKIVKRLYGDKSNGNAAQHSPIPHRP